MVLRMPFVRAQQLLLGWGVAYPVINTHIADRFPLTRHVDDEPVYKSTRPACLVVNGFNCGRHNLKIVIGFEGFVHLGLVPKSLE